MEIERWEFLDSDKVDDGDDEFVEVHEVGGVLRMSRSNLNALPLPLKKEDIFQH